MFKIFLSEFLYLVCIFIVSNSPQLFRMCDILSCFDNVISFGFYVFIFICVYIFISLFVFHLAFLCSFFSSVG